MVRCVIANESRIVRHIIRRVVERRGFDVVETCDGPEVIDVCQQSVPNLLCLDESLPDLDGIAVMRLLRAENPTQPLPPTLFPFIENDGSLLTRALAAGAGEFVQKPFTARQLDDAIGRLTIKNPGRSPDF